MCKLMHPTVVLCKIIILTALLVLPVTSCDLFSPGLGDKIDTGTPVVGIESHGNGEYVGGVITMSGYATDDLGIKRVSVSQGSNNYAANLSGENWSLDLDTSLFTDGDLELTISAVDSSDKSVSIKVLLIVDNSPPSVMVTTPTEYNDYGIDPEDENDGAGDDEIFSFNKSVTIKGEAADTTRVQKVYVSLYKKSDDSVVIDHAEATGTSSWYYIFDSLAFHGDADPAEIYYFIVTAEDYSGNTSSWFYHFDDVLDLGSYNIEEINASDNEGVTIAGLSDLRLSGTTDPRMEITIDPDSDAPQFTIISPAEDSVSPSDNIFSSPQKFSGFVEDDDLAGIDESTLTLTVTDWDPPYTEILTAVYGVDADLVLSGNQWTFEASLVDGEYGIQLTADDAEGKTGTSNLVPFKVSSFAPVVSIDAPQQGIYIGKGSATSFSVSVVGASGDEVYIDLDDSGTYDGDEKMSGTGGTYTMDVTEGSGIFSLSSDGDDIFQIRAGVDPNYGTATLQYTGDITDPTVDFSYPADGQSVNGLINISGTSADNYVIGEVYVLISDESDWSALSTDYVSDWITPSGTYNWSISDYDTSSLTDGGTYYIYTKAFDDAGNGSDLSLADSSISIVIDQESDRPVIDLSNMEEGGSSNSLAQDASIIGIIEDDDKVDASTLYVRVDINNDSNFDGVDLTGDLDTDDANESEQWVPVLPAADDDDDTAILSWNYSLENVPQGTHSMQIRVHDTVSDGVTNDEGTNPNYAELAITEFIVDYGPPTLAITTPANGAIFNSDFTIEGTATDPNHVTDVEITFDAGSTYASLYSNAGGTEVVNWSYDFSVNTDGTTDGDYSYQIRATDLSGGVTTLDRQLIVDATVPSITFEQPPELKTVNGTDVDIQGTANDNRSIAAVYISIDQQGTDPAADVSTWDTVDSGIYSWSHSMDSTAFNNTETPVNYVISLAAVDTAGNATGYLDYQRTVIVDQSSDRPVISFNDIDKDETDAANNVLVGANTLSGVIEDDDSIDPALFSGDSIEISIDGGTWEAVSNPPSASGKLVVWRHDISTYGEGVHTVRVRARDSLSNGTVGASSASAEYASNFNWAIEDSSDQGGIPFILNIGPPSITVDNPAPYSYHDSNVTIDGTAVDANGVSDVDISFDNGSTWDSITITPATSVSWSYTLPVNADGSDDDTYSYIVRCIDDYGSSAMENGQFTVDSTDPTNVINRPGTGDYVNGDMVISGTSGDNISLSEVYYNIALSTDPVPVFPDDYALLSGTYAWEETIDTTLLSDDLYALRIGSIDIAGNESAVSSVNFTVDQSSDIPVFAYTNADADYDTLAEASGNLLETGAKIIGNITDDDSVDYTTIAVTVYNSDDSVMTAETAVSNPPSANGTFLNWSHDLSALPDGEYYAVFTADDINGVTATTGPLFFTIDLSPASIDVASPLSGSYQSADFTITGTASDENGLLFGDHDGDGGATTAETDYIEIYDGSSWQNAAVDVAGNWSCDIDVSALGDGSKTYQFRATDLFGKSATDTLSFTIDTVAPAISVVSPAGGDWTNVNSLSLNGTASDANGVVSVEVSTNYADWSSLTGTLSWSGLLDISGEADQLNKTIYFRSTDIAGNTVNDTVDINIDRTVPTLEETAIGTTETQYESSGYSLSGTLSDNLTGSLPTYDHDSDGGAVTEEVEYIEISLNAGPSELVPVSGGTWNYPVSFSGGTMDYELSITDRAGNSSYYLTRTVIEDDSAPSLDSIVTPTGAESYLSGSAYSLTGTASDTGDAGLDSVYWWAGDQGASAPSTASPYTDWNSAVGTASWSGTLDLSSLGEGDKTLHAFAVDKCGNASSVSTVDSMVDQAAPVLDEDGLGGSSASASGDVSFEITITESNGIVHGDLLDGAPVEDVDYFEVMINGSDWAADAVRAEYTGADMTYTVSAADFSDGDNEVLFRAIDLAGRTSSVIKRDIFFDNTPPVVTFINLDTSSVVNGESLTVQGTTTDSASTISSVTIAYNGPEDSGYSSEQTVSGSFYSWTYELDLTPSDVYYSDNPISLRVTATDGAGNTSQSELTFAIDQEGDMPALNLSGINVFAQSATAAVTSDDYILAGVLCDDDGVDLDSLSVIFDSSSLSYRVISGSDDDTAITWFADLSGYAEGTYGFSVTADDSLGNTAEGNHSGMIDSEIPVLGSDGKISGSAEDDDAFDSSSLVLLQNGSDQSGSVAIGADSTYVPWSYELPASDDLYFFEINGADATGAAIPVDWAKYGGESLKTMVLKDSGNPVITVTSPSQGAYVNGTAATSGSAYDDLAINSLTITAVQSDNVTSVELTSDPGVALDTTEGTGEYYYDSSAGQYVWDFALERLPDAYENDSITLVYEAEDIAGNSTVKERAVTIDTVEPVVSINSPGNGNIVNGTVTFQGTVSDVKLSTVEIKLGSNSYETLSGTYNWSKEVTAATLISYATDLGDGTYNLPVTVRATDAAGNIGLTSGYSIIINPDTDKPIVNITSPDNNSTLGGSIMIVGSATDDDAVDSVEVRIDFNGDGDFNDILDLNDDGDTTDEFETESSWVEITNFSNGIWSKEINSLGELYKSSVDSADNVITGSETIDNAATGSITAQIHAWDINLVESIVTELNMSLDETFPEILDFSVTGSPEAISGTFDLQWDIEDNEEITSVAISYDGGLTYTDIIYDGSSTISTLTGSKTVDSDADLGLAGLASSVNVRMRVVDNTTYVSFANLTINIDNVAPAGVYTGRIEDIGTGDVWVAGTATDTGAVRGIEKIEVYIIQDGEILEPEGDRTNDIAPETVDFGEGDVSYTTNDLYKIIIDNDDATEIESPEDGYAEYMSIAGSSVEWQAEFDSTNIDNSDPLEVHFVIWDNAGNATHYVETMMMVGTDLDQDGSVETDEMVAYPQGFKATDLLKVEMDPGSNTDLYLYIEHDSSSETDIDSGDGPMAYTIDISGYAEGSTTFDIQVRDSSQGDATVIQKILSVEIVGADTTPPTVVLNDLSLSSVVEGHLETNSNYNGADMDVSGTIQFAGTANDNSRIQTINMIVEDSADVEIANVEIASWNGGLFEAKNGATFTQNELSWQDGHTVSFTIDWDSAGITGTVDQDIEVRFVATDFVALTGEDSETFDVVSFISSIDRGTAFNVFRSKYGYYSLRRGTDNATTGLEGDSIRIYGYNLFDTTADTITFGSSGAVSLTDPGAEDYLTVEVPTDATSGALTLTVNGFEAINNLNSNNESYHSEASGYTEGSDEWTDDRYVHIWQSTENTSGSNQGYFEGSENPVYPAMAIDESTGILYSSWSNYADSVVLYGTNDGSVNSTTIFSSYDPLEHTDIDFGNRATVVYNANTYGNNTWNENGAGGVHVWDNQADNDSDGGAGLFYNSEELWHDEMLMQFINQRVVNDGDNIHISYFDTETKAVKYHYIQSNDQTYGELQTWINLDGGSDGDDGNSSSQVVNVPRNNTYTVTAVLVSNGDTVASGQDIITLSNGTTYTAPAAGIVDGLLTVGDSLAGGTGWWGTDYTLFLVSDFNRVVEYGTGVRSNTVGAYSAIDVQTNGNPVVAYYDSSNQTVKLAVASANDPSAADWTLMTVMDAGDTNYQYSGKYISMKIDSNNDVHLVFYRNSTGDLIYMKSETDPINDGSYTFGDSVIIDSIGSVGAWADITMDENDSPVISYLDSSRADTFDGLKMAYYDSAESDWDYMNVPLGYEISNYRTSVECDIRTTGGGDAWDWETAIGYSSSDYYRIAYYIPE